MVSRWSRGATRPPPPREAPPPLPPGPPPPTYAFTGNQGSAPTEFSFRAGDGTAPRFPRSDRPSQASSRGRHGRSRPLPADDHRQGRDRRRHNDGRRDRYQPFTPSSRPLLNSQRAGTPEQFSAMIQNRHGETKFMLDKDVSDSDEQEMEVDSSPGSSVDGHDNGYSDGSSRGLHWEPTLQDHGHREPPRKKQFREEDLQLPTREAPKPRWSNPDPYTALPPPDESQRKKKDVVKLIRKARNTAEQAGKPNSAVGTNDDFIALSFDDEAVENEGLETRRDVSNEVRSLRSKASAGARSFDPCDRLGEQSTSRALGEQNLGAPYRPVDVWPPTSVDAALGNRKRTHDDRIVDKPTKRGAPKNEDGQVLSTWRARDDAAVPWGGVDHSRTANMGFWLHKEICDWFAYVRPRKFEQVVREDLVQRLRTAMVGMYADCDVRCFGSFASGLYLPTADMDLVCVSQNFLATGQPKEGLTGKNRYMYAIANYLKVLEIPRRGSIVVIAKAKVPIIKFIDQITGVKVDLSFENSTGIVAVDTCLAWKAQFPAMPILVMLVKQFLTMRGLDEVHTGGMGGFAVTCLVTSLLQTIPQVQSGNLVPERHLGETLMEFLDLYGNRFNLEGAVIRLNPPGYFEKRLATQFRNQTKSTRLSIEDPNRPENDITAGTTGIRLIVHCFARAYEALQGKMLDLRHAECSRRQGQSILWTILGGDYSSFDEQRESLRRVYEQRHQGDLELSPEPPGTVQRLAEPHVSLSNVPKSSMDKSKKRSKTTAAIAAEGPNGSGDVDPTVTATAKTETKNEKRTQLNRKRSERFRMRSPQLQDVPDAMNAYEQEQLMFKNRLLDNTRKKQKKQKKQNERRHGRRAARRQAEGKAEVKDLA